MSQVVQCPICRQDFKVALPSKLAKGSCPKCKGELMLLPDGTLRSYSTERIVTPVKSAVQVTLPTVKKQTVKPPVDRQPKTKFPVRQAAVLPATKPIADRKPMSANASITKPPPFAKTALPPTKRFAEIGANNGTKEVSSKGIAIAAERHFIKLGVMLLLSPFVVGGGLYATRMVPIVDTFLTRSGKITIKGYGKLFAAPPDERVKPHEVPKLQSEESVKQNDLSKQQKEADNTAYEKNRLNGLISEKLDKFRLKKRTIKKYSEGALKDEQKTQVENMEKDLEKDKNEIEDMKKEYQNKFGELYKEGDDN